MQYRAEAIAAHQKNRMAAERWNHRGPIVLGLLIVILMTSGCAHTYWIDRGRDAKDIFTAAVGTGGGVKARIGPFEQGIVISTNYAGIQEGDSFRGYGLNGHEHGEDVMLLLIGCEFGNQSRLAEMRHKNYGAPNFFGIYSPLSPDNPPKYTAPFFTDINVVVGLGGTLKLGVNPGELLDFILGWTTLDIYGDDIATPESEPRQSADD